MKPAVVCDFDGTITVGEVSYALLERFGQGDWQREVDALWQGKMSLAESMARQFALVRCSKEELVKFVRETTVIREGFDAFARYCLDNGIPFTICSAGMDVYIEAALGQFLWYPRLNVVVGRATFTPRGIKVDFPQGRDNLDFKATLVEEMKGRGYAVVYVGDGVSDEGAAVHADFVFAREHLLALCQRKSIPHSAFDDFNQVQRGLELLRMGAFLESRGGARQ